MKTADTAGFMEFIKRIPGLNSEYAIENIGNSVQLYECLIKKISRLIPSNIAAMDTALDRCDMNAFGISAHGLKGTLNQAGHMRLAGLAAELEAAAKKGDVAYCSTSYNAFKEAVLDFNGAISSVVKGTGTAGLKPVDSRLSAHTETLVQAKEAAVGFDSAAAIECLSRLADFRFCESTDSLIMRAMDELELFRPLKAAQYITELLEICENEG